MARCAGQQTWLAESRRSPLVTSKTSFAADLAIPLTPAIMLFLSPQARLPYRSISRRLALCQEKIYTGPLQGRKSADGLKLRRPGAFINPRSIADRPGCPRPSACIFFSASASPKRPFLHQLTCGPPGY